jgi:hypothetical protein
MKVYDLGNTLTWDEINGVRLENNLICKNPF